MDDLWSWITNIPSSDDWPASDSPLVHQLAKSTDKSILLQAERTAGSDTETLVTFSICIHGFHPSNPSKTLWVSNPNPLSSPSFHLFLLQLLQEVIARAPSSTTTHPPPKLDPDSTSRALVGSHQASNFFSLALLSRLFWLCACDAPADVGFLFFQTLDSALERALDCKLTMKDFLVSIGADWEERFMRSLGYMLAKCCILRGLQGSSSTRLPGCCFSYAAESHGLLVLKGYAPVPAMNRTGAGSSGGYANLEAKESVLRYSLAHQQLEAVVQLEYSVCFRDPRFIRVDVRVDNIRLHVVRLAFGKTGEEGDEEETTAAAEERHFPSRVRVWVGPEVGSAYVSSLSLGRSTDNPEREVETERTVKGSFGNSKFPKVKAAARSAARSRARSWRWEQEAEGSAGVFEGVLCDTSSGAEVAAWRPAGGGKGGDPRSGLRRRYSGPGRAFSKGGGLVVAGDELGEGLSWRVGREMEGSVLRWRFGGKVWVSYWPNELKSGYFETRCVEWHEEVDLHLAPKVNLL